MRPVITILIAIFLLSGIYAYTEFANHVRPEPVEYVANYSESRDSVRINRTFDCVGNAEFGMPMSLGLIFKEDKVINREDKVPASEIIEIELPKVEVGRNAIEVFANLPDQFSIDIDEGGEAEFDSFDAKADAMRVELLRDGNVIAQETFWVEPGLNSVSGSLYFEIKDENNPEAEQ